MQSQGASWVQKGFLIFGSDLWFRRCEQILSAKIRYVERDLSGVLWGEVTMKKPPSSEVKSGDSWIVHRCFASFLKQSHGIAVEVNAAPKAASILKR